MRRASRGDAYGGSSLIGHAKLNALRVKRIVFGMVWREIEPVRIAMGADEPLRANGAFERANAFHAFEWIDARQPTKPVGVALDCPRDKRVWQVIATGQAGTTGFVCDQEAAGNTRRIHAVDQLRQLQSPHQRFIDLHFPDEKARSPARTAGQRLGGPDIDDGVYCLKIITHGRASPAYGIRS